VTQSSLGGAREASVAGRRLKALRALSGGNWRGIGGERHEKN
jgi:hypothetical protein